MRAFVSALFCLLAGAAAAQEIPDSSIPPALRDWRGWVLHDTEFRACPFLFGDVPGQRSAHVCAWPARLELNAEAGGASFVQRWHVDVADWLPLPGDVDSWPQEVSVDGKLAVVLPRDGFPAVWVTPGNVELRGRIPWMHRPQQLRIPPTVGLVSLRVDGKAVEPLERSADTLTLGRGEVAEPEADALTLRVFRKLVDELPAQLETQLQFDIAGQAREESFAPVLPQGFVPVALEGELPARLDPDGKLHVQVQPGTFELTLRARATAPLSKATAKLGEAPWPDQEIWSYEAHPELRVTSAGGANPIDPAQADVPDDWQALPAFALADGGVLTIEERSRGLAGDESNRLNLQREAWLGFDGDAIYAKDRIVGQMRRGWRLDVAPPYRLQRAEANGEGLLVTRGAAAGESGVELRHPAVNLYAGVRVDAGSGRLPITGWKDSFDSVNLELHLPFGYRLLGAPGADRADGSWVSRWSLLDVFLVAIAGLLAWRLFGLGGGALALLYLVVGYHEPEAPRWALILTLALVLLLRALPGGRLQTFTRWLARLALIGLVLLTLPFLADQVRFALYPQLEGATFVAPQGGFALQEEYDRAVPRPVAAPAAPPPQEATIEPPVPVVNMPASQGVARAKAGSGKANEKEKLEAVVVTGSRITQGNLISQRYASNSVIQAGAGEPSWRYGTSYSLGWSGPVLPDQSVRLVIAPPWLTRLLRVGMLALLLLTAANLARRLFGLRRGGLSPGASAAAVLALVAALPTAPARAADLPDDTFLQQLRERLQPAPKCVPGCASLARADVRVAGDGVHLGLTLAAAERVAVPLPQADASLVLDAVRLDGAAVEAVARLNEQLWVAVGRGVHRLDLDFRSVDSDHVALKFPLKPAWIAPSLEGWQAAGVSEQHLLGDTLTLTRERREAADANAPARPSAQQFPPYVSLRRDIRLDLDWSMDLSAQRVAPQHGGFATRVPLLPGEQVLSASTRTENGQVLVSFDADQEASSWNSRLPRSDTLTLTAPPLAERAEVWRITASPMWHTEFSGVPEVMSEESGEYWTHEFHPLPGETLSVKVTRPDALEGRSVAIDSVHVASAAGTRALDTSLDLTIRSTQGGEHAVALPDGAEVLGVSKNGQVLNLRARDGKLSLPLSPGAQSFSIRVRQPIELGIVARLPVFRLGAEAANVDLGLGLPSDRWVLFASGPRVGPAVLYWGELVVMILVAWALSRLRRTPLRLHHWLLLGIGFSTVSWAALLVVVAWLFVLDARARWISPRHEGVFNLAQIGIVLLTVVALGCLVASIPYGLLDRPAMHITGAGSTPFELHWFADQVADATPAAGVFSLPLWAYRLAMLAWALWLANALIAWLRWGFGAWVQGGYWRNAPRPAAQAAPVPQESASSGEGERG